MFDVVAATSSPACSSSGDEGGATTTEPQLHPSRRVAPPQQRRRPPHADDHDRPGRARRSNRCDNYVAQAGGLRPGSRRRPVTRTDVRRRRSARYFAYHLPTARCGSHARRGPATTNSSLPGQGASPARISSWRPGHVGAAIYHPNSDDPRGAIDVRRSARRTQRVHQTRDIAAACTEGFGPTDQTPNIDHTSSTPGGSMTASTRRPRSCSSTPNGTAPTKQSVGAATGVDRSADEARRRLVHPSLESGRRRPSRRLRR